MPGLVLHRHRTVLAALDALEGRAAVGELEALVLAYSREIEPPPYESVAGRAFTLDAELGKLTERGYVDKASGGYELTRSGQSAARAAIDRDRIAAFAITHRGARGDDLAPRPDAARDTAVLSTIGYEGRSLERYLNELATAGVAILCDVRRNPISRRFGFARRRLAAACEAVGVRYEHLPELGIASQERRDLETAAEYDALFDAYERTTMVHQRAAIARIADWVRHGERVALTCYEREPARCHRLRVARAIERDVPALAAVHL